MSSSNPFRKKGAGPESRFPPVQQIDTSGTQASPQPKTSFRDTTTPELPVGERKNKPVKKVRVLSPPPLSPDSPEWPFNAAPPPVGQLTQYDPFDGPSSTEDSDRDSTATPPPPRLQQQQPPPPPPPQSISAGPPANPFSKTLEDMEPVNKEEELVKERKEEGAVLKAASAARGSLNVDAFHRLLMTGNADSSQTASGQSSPGTEQTAAANAQAMAKASRFDSSDSAEAGPEPLENIITNHDRKPDDVEEGVESDSSTNVQIGSRGKKAPPPPPSSRHGKSLRLDLKDDLAETTLSNAASSSDVNKPLPPAPARSSIDEDAESPFDREAAGKIPEQDPAQAVPQSAPGSAKKPVPAPPPRRGHARLESKAPPAGAAITQNRDDEGPPLSSQEPALSRTDSVRPAQIAPAPPPPRRPHAGAKSVPSPTATSFNMTSSSSTSVSQSEPEHHTAASDSSSLRDAPTSVKTSAPPPPPARNPSTRRPASIISIDAPSRRISAEAKPREGMGAPPPPPPPRQRGSSRSSVEGPPRRTSVDSVGKLRPSLNDTTSSQSYDGVAEEAGSHVDILADLTALQREVDALRGKIN